MIKPPLKPADPAPHPVLDRSAKLRERAQARNLTCKDKVWRGWHVKHRFVCNQGHALKLSPADVLGSCGACRVCRDAAQMQRLQALAAAADAVCLDTQWRGYEALYRFRCAQGHEWSLSAKRKPGCPVCIKAAAAAGKRLQDGLQRLVQVAKERGGVCLSEVYLGKASHHRFRCAEGHEWESSEVLRGSWCALCANARKQTQYRLADGLARLQLAAADKGGLCLSELYERSKEHYRFRCAQGHEWRAVGAGILRGGWCSICAYTPRRLGLEAAQAAAQARGGQCLSKSYVNNAVKMSWMCDRGHVWQAKFGSVRRGHWCPECAYMARITNKNSKAWVRYRAAGPAPSHAKR